ncbi:MAG TPA: hypothetical protein ENG87_05855 [Candidatus Pacearchaeota archaeon]|nr:hypothetical protein [Candidatus Pacearchaeota archaeon]
MSIFNKLKKFLKKGENNMPEQKKSNTTEINYGEIIQNLWDSISENALPENRQITQKDISTILKSIIQNDKEFSELFENQDIDKLVKNQFPAKVYRY